MSVLERGLVREIGRRRWQFVAIGITIWLGVALFAASYDAYTNLKASYADLFVRTSFADVTAEGGDPTSVAAAMSATDGMTAVATRSIADVPVRVADHSLVGRLVGMPAGFRPAVNDVLLLSGSLPTDYDPDGVLVERHLADAFGLVPGDSLRAHVGDEWRTLKVRGIVASPEYVWLARSRQEVLVLPTEFGVVFAPQALVDAAPALQRVSQVMATTGPGADLAGVARAALAAGATNTFDRDEQPSNATLAEDIEGFGELSYMFPTMFLTAAALATYVLLGRMIAAQRQQIGLLLAVGFRRRRVFAHYLAFGLLVGGIGAALGAVTGAALAAVITEVYTGAIGIPVTVVELHPTTMLIGLVIGLTAGAIAAFVPALRASRLSPATAMSGVVGSGNGGRSLLERVVPPLAGLPARWRMVIRGMGRARVRSISTVVGVVIAVTLVFVSWAMIDTVDILLGQQFERAELQDASVVVVPGQAENLVPAITDQPGVAAAEPVARLRVTLVAGDERYATSLAAYEPDTRMHGFHADGTRIGLPADGILLGSALRSVLHVGVGDEVDLHLAGFDTPVRTTVAGFVDEPLGSFAYASRGALTDWIGSAGVTSASDEIAVRLDPAADRAAAIDRLQSTDGVLAVADSRAVERTARSLMGLFYAFIGTMLVLGGLLAFAVLFNLMVANIGERITELASLRAAGMSAGQLGRLITAENLLLTGAGIVLGLGVGYIGAAEFMASFSSDLFSFTLHVRPTTFLGTAAGIAVAALITQLPVLRAVGRIDIARVVRERAS